VDTRLADALPPVCDLTKVADRNVVDVVLALPLMDASGGNLENGAESERPRRWVAARERVQDLAGHELTEIAVQRYALRL
ncbi:type VI secretion system baseplate subunit TssK, partial [Escherichia coli]